MREVDRLRPERSQIQSLSAGIDHLERRVSKLKALDGRIKRIANLQEVDGRVADAADNSKEGEERNRYMVESGSANIVDSSVGDKNLAGAGLHKPL